MNNGEIKIKTRQMKQEDGKCTTQEMVVGEKWICENNIDIPRGIRLRYRLILCTHTAFWKIENILQIFKEQ